VTHIETNTSRVALLSEIENLPNTAFVSSRHAAALLDGSPSVLANWRSQRRGPAYCGNGDFIRYRVIDLHHWMAQRSHEVPHQNSEVSPHHLTEASP